MLPHSRTAQVRSLIEGVDPLALTEHAQLHRLPEDCKVRPRWRLQLSQPQSTGCCCKACCCWVARAALGREPVQLASLSQIRVLRMILHAPAHPQNPATPSSQVWGRGPVTLLGDSAHLATPMLAQVCCQRELSAAALAAQQATRANTVQKLSLLASNRFEAN